MSNPDYTFSVSAITASGRIEIDSLLSGYKWGAGSQPGTGVSLTYSFGAAGLSAYRDGYLTPDPGSVWTLSGTAQAAIRQALGTWTAVANISCIEVPENALSCGDIRFGGSGVPDTAYTVMPVVDLPEAGDVWFGTTFADPGLSWTPGSYTYQTIVHELGHAFGLKHLHEEYGGFPVAPTGIDYQLYSTMSYRSFPGASPGMGYWQDRFPTTPMVDDIAAIQYLYGANMSTNAGDTVYSWAPGQAIFETIWDGGGNDTISWANQTTDARIDLRPGSYSDLGPSWKAGFYLEPRTLGIAYDCWIENAIGGSGNDLLIGNALDNALYGGAGDDTLIGGAGNNLLDGGEGFDTAVFEGAPSSYTILHTGAGEVTVSGPQGVNTLRSIENLSFGDLTLALSRDATPGTVANTFFGVANSASGRQFLQEASAYSGPVQNLQWQLIGSNDGEAIVGGASNDFINGLGGMDAIDGGAGDDVLDGGTGSNFLTGGAGHDTFFLDGRSGDPVWSTVTDLEAGELVTVWGWQPGQSTLTWEDWQGAGGFEGATAHIDLDGNGRIDASVTLSGHAVSSLSTMPGVVGDSAYLGIRLFG
ncbi:serralysin [Azospirillum brasilense]|uniref:Serralysin n=1 Tax=Azospirillum brasilense TaxID=192 RepID=A0A560AL26_AZOBR|nr:serralysin [Azospirillum brasilense]